MDANKLLTLKWVPVDSWKELNTTGISKKIEKVDVVNFIEIKMHEISYELQIPYTEVKSIVESENKTFFLKLKKIFKGTTLKKNDATLVQVLSLLKLPDVSSAPRADVVIALMKSLPPEERRKVFEYFNVPNVSKAAVFLNASQIIE